MTDESGAALVRRKRIAIEGAMQDADHARVQALMALRDLQRDCPHPNTDDRSHAMKDCRTCKDCGKEGDLCKPDPYLEAVYANGRCFGK